MASTERFRCFHSLIYRSAVVNDLLQTGNNIIRIGVLPNITTVSNTYAEEIKMPFYGEGLDGLMRARANSLRGIVNGIDYDDFTQETDIYIVQQYTA